MKTAHARQERLAAQQEFMEILREGKTDAARYPGGTRGLQAYRANAQVLAEQVLGQAFPRLRAGFGDASFSAMAWACWRQYPPALGDMGEWGAALPRFLLDHGVEPWWVDLARLEWAAHQAERARDDVFDAESLALMAQEDPKDITLLLRSGSVALTVHPCAWTCWQDPVRASAACEDENWNSQQPALHLWVWRAPWQAQVQPIGSAEAAFMAALMQGVSLAQALAATQRPTDTSPARSATIKDVFEFDIWLQRALAGGWLVGAEAIGDGQG
jgi:hypothetical protein